MFGSRQTGVHAYAKVGMRDAALRALDGALATARRTGDHSYLAEVYRLQGEITKRGVIDVLRHGS